MTHMLRLLAGEDFDTDLRLQNIDFGVYVSGKVVQKLYVIFMYVHISIAYVPTKLVPAASK